MNRTRKIVGIATLVVLSPVVLTYAVLLGLGWAIGAAMDTASEFLGGDDIFEKGPP